jgi:L-fuconolactonase
VRIDAHQHFWKFDSENYAWITDKMQRIRRDFLPHDLQPVLSNNQFDGCISVQVHHSDEETREMLRLASIHSFIKGIVGWVDFRMPDVGQQLERLTEFKYLKGFRHIVQGESPGFLLQKAFITGFGHLPPDRFTYDILIYHHQLKEAVHFVEKFPNHKFILDHMAKPLIAEGVLDPWKKNIKELAAHENVLCKISGMVTEGRWNTWLADDFTPYLDTVLDCFGAKRLIYGSDWPVCLLSADYENQLQLVERYISTLSGQEKRAIMGENAVQFYNL